jgi:hypothetical protein
MKKIIVLLAMAAMTAALAVWASSRPAEVKPVLGGKGHWAAALAVDMTTNVSDGITIAAGGANESAFILKNASGSVTLTPQAGYYIGGKTIWTDLNPLAGPSAAGDIQVYQISCDLVRVSAAGCSGCRWSAYWIGYVK